MDKHGVIAVALDYDKNDLIHILTAKLLQFGCKNIRFDGERAGEFITFDYDESQKIPSTFTVEVPVSLENDTQTLTLNDIK